MSTWSLVHVQWHQTEKLERYLQSGWEPFAVTEDGDTSTVWLRKLSTPERS